MYWLVLLPMIISLTSELSNITRQIESLNSTMQDSVVPELEKIAKRIGDLDHE